MFRESVVVHSFKVVDPVLFVFESHNIVNLLLKKYWVLLVRILNKVSFVA